MKARKKTGVIEVQQYRQGVTQVWPLFVQMSINVNGFMSVWNEPQQTWINVNDGDYVRLDNPKDVYPIAADYFAENYEPIAEPVSA